MRKHVYKEILYLLLDNDGPFRIKDIANILHISEKTVWNKLHDEQLVNILGKNVQLELKTNNGVCLSGSIDALHQLKLKLDLLNDNDKEENIYLNNQIILLLLTREENLTMQDVMDHFLITKNSLMLALTHIAIRLKKFDLQLEKRQNAGIQIKGNEINIRQMMENTILQQCGLIKQHHHTNTTFDESITQILKEIKLDTYLQNALTCVKMIQQELLGSFTDEGRKEIVIQILITNVRFEQEHLIHFIDQETFTSNLQFHRFLKIFENNRILLKENDYLYLWKRCVTNRFSTKNQRNVDKKFYMLSKELLNSILDLKEQESEEVEYLIQNLAFHIYQAVNRSYIGIRVHNPILNKVKEKYGKFYSLVLTNVSKFEKEYQISLNEDEIGFITIYICAIYEKSISNQYYRVLLVSDEGVGQTQLLSMHIVNNFPNLLIHQTSSSLHLQEEQVDEADIIISTCSLLLKQDARHKYVRISNFIDQQDLCAISTHLLNMGKLHNASCPIENMKSCIDFKYFNSHMDTKEELIQNYLQIAEQFGYCDESYIESVIQREVRASTSIGKGVAIPHGDDIHIMKPAVFFVRNATPILWGEEYSDIIIFLILKFDSIAQNKQFFMRLYACVSKTELVRQVENNDSLKRFEEYILKGEMT